MQGRRSTTHFTESTVYFRLCHARSVHLTLSVQSIITQVHLWLWKLLSRVIAASKKIVGESERVFYFSKAHQMRH